MDDPIDRDMGEQNSALKGKSVFARTIEFLKNDDQLKDAFCFNMFTQDVEHFQDNIILSPTAKKGATVSDQDIQCLRYYMTVKDNFSPSKGNLDDAVVNVAMIKRYHPIKDYLEGLRWDGVNRLDRWLIDVCGAEDSPYTRAVGRKVLIAAVKRVYEPGCLYAQLVILEGRQRMYKSRLVKAMGGDFYASIHLKTQDTKSLVEDMRGKWILEIEELAGFGKQETEYMKAFISRQSDRVRLSFGHRSKDYPRQSIMIATMNPDAENRYLNDPTGNFRYWPVSCSETEKIKIDVFLDIKDQLFAEAYAAHQKEPMWMNEEEDKLAQVEQEKRLQGDPWEPIIGHWLEDEVKNKYLKRITTNRIAIDCLRMAPDKINSAVWRRVGRVLIHGGWMKHRDTNGAHREWYYTPPASMLGQETLDDVKGDLKWAE